MQVLHVISHFILEDLIALKGHHHYHTSLTPFKIFFLTVLHFAFKDNKVIMKLVINSLSNNWGNTPKFNLHINLKPFPL
jgi:hypothetical protein